MPLEKERKKIKFLSILHTSWENKKSHPQLFPQMEAHDVNDTLLIMQVCFLLQKTAIAIGNQ